MNTEQPKKYNLKLFGKWPTDIVVKDPGLKNFTFLILLAEQLAKPFGNQKNQLLRD